MPLLYEATLTFPAPLSRVVRADPDAPLPRLPVTPGPAARREEQQRQQLEQERQAVERVLHGISEAARRLQQEDQARREQLERAAVELAVAIARKLLHDQFQAGSYPVEALARAAVSRLPAGQPVRLRLHPADKALLEQRLGGAPLLAGSPAVEVAADPSLSRGDCQADAGEVSVATRLEAQVAELHRLLVENVGHAAAGPAEAVP